MGLRRRIAEARIERKIDETFTTHHELEFERLVKALNLRTMKQIITASLLLGRRVEQGTLERVIRVTYDDHHIGDYADLSHVPETYATKSICHEHLTVIYRRT